MKLYLMRHSKAASMLDAGVASDEERPLTLEGLQRAETVGRALNALGISPDAIWCSPLRRAKQTADIVALALGKPQLVKPQEILRPQMTPEPFLEALQQSPAASVLAIGHQPDLGELVSFLQWGLHAAQMHLSEATVVGFELPSPASRDRARLELLLPPDAAEKIVR